MADVVLAGDIGGTKTDLALYDVRAGRTPVSLRDASFASPRFGGLEQVIDEFLRADAGGSPKGRVPSIRAAAFGVAGPIVGDAVTTTNLPWRVEGARLRRLLGGAPVRLLNDLEATAHGALGLTTSDLVTLNRGVERPGNQAVIAAGTGLGQAFLHWDGQRHEPAATEGGHVDFAPRDDREVALLRFLQRLYPRVSYERVVSGPGLANLLRFLDEELHRPVAADVRARLRHEDAGVVIGEAGMAGTCVACVEAVDMFIDIYGAQAGNLALTVMATGGVYVGGGIVTKLLPKVTSGAFMRAFTAKGRYTGLMAEIPVHVILNPRTALLGAARVAAALLP